MSERPPRRDRHRQRGFSLITVFLLITLMVGVAAALLVTTQTDIQVTAHDREAMVTFYAAEAGVAFGKDWLVPQIGSIGVGAWNPVLTSNHANLCLPSNGAQPGISLKANNPIAYDTARGTTYQFCVHNNAADPNYYLPIPTGDTTDGDGIIVIESYGRGPEATRSHITVEVSTQSTATPAEKGYAQEGGQTKEHRGDATTINTAVGVVF